MSYSHEEVVEAFDVKGAEMLQMLLNDDNSETFEESLANYRSMSQKDRDILLEAYNDRILDGDK